MGVFAPSSAGPLLCSLLGKKFYLAWIDNIHTSGSVLDDDFHRKISGPHTAYLLAYLLPRYWTASRWRVTFTLNPCHSQVHREQSLEPVSPRIKISSFTCGNFPIGSVFFRKAPELSNSFTGVATTGGANLYRTTFGQHQFELDLVYNVLYSLRTSCARVCILAQILCNLKCW